MQFFSFNDSIVVASGRYMVCLGRLKGVFTVIRPIEMQMLLPRTEAMSHTQQHENQSVVNVNSNAAEEVAKEVKHNSETVIQKDANEFAEYQYDAREPGNGNYSDPRKKKKRNGKQNEDNKAPGSVVNDDNEDEAGEKYQPRINIQI